MANMLTGIISITISAVILANVFIVTLKDMNQSYACTQWNGTATVPASCAWGTSEIAMWGLITLIGIVGLLYGVLSIFGLA